MVTGFKAPHGTRLHRPQTLRFGTSTIQTTWCGINLPTDSSWDETATGEAYTCRYCQVAYDHHTNAMRPWSPTERRTYTTRRHPGLISFTPDHDGPARIGTSWRVQGAPRTVFQTTRDARTPPGRPWHLRAGAIDGTPLGYFRTTTEAVDYTISVQSAGLLVTLLRQANTDAWNPETDAATFLERHTPKETNPA